MILASLWFGTCLKRKVYCRRVKKSQSLTNKIVVCSNKIPFCAVVKDKGFLSSATDLEYQGCLLSKVWL